jgi:hypothetical protein
VSGVFRFGKGITGDNRGMHFVFGRSAKKGNMVSKRMLIAISVFALLPWTRWSAYAAPATGKTVSETGCVDKGDEPDELSISGSNGKKAGEGRCSASDYPEASKP